MSNQKTTQMNPRAPVSYKATCQPQAAVTNPAINGANSPPILLPELNTPVARARSRTGNHVATHLMQVGKLPPSPSPSTTRAIVKPATEATKPWAVEAKHQTVHATARPIRTPTLSVKAPMLA